ncbi:MAG: hypothetical protein OEM38_11715, partial [Gammaproteobacteria bacterium]|nr:hypothetical protein [Gammaproteobacteria bacterium]
KSGKKKNKTTTVKFIVKNHGILQKPRYAIDLTPLGNQLRHLLAPAFPPPKNTQAIYRTPNNDSRQC